MNQGIKGIALFLTGWMIALVTNYLGGLDLGLWLPVVVTGIEVVAMAMMLVGIRGFHERHKYFNAAIPVTVFLLMVALAKACVLLISMSHIADWMAVFAMALVLADDILFMMLTGLMLLGFVALYKDAGEEKAADRLRYNWVLFLTFAILYVAIQITSVLLVNEPLSALTYAVPALGLPMLIAGGTAVWRLASN